MDESLSVWRERDIVVVRRDRPLPPICLFTGQPAEYRVTCLFHWQERPTSAGGLFGLVRHYWQDVWKARLGIPLAAPLLARRRIGWLLLAATIALAAATIAALIVVQNYIAILPAGPTKKKWNDIAPPAVALGGFLLTALAGLASYKVMPMPTVRLKPVRITGECVWLAGAASEYLAQIPERSGD